MALNFTKMQGLGNDFMIIDATQQPCNLSALQIRQLADRHFGVGFDQLLIILPPTQPGIDFNYRIYNADGSSAEQCGNGARCIGRFIHEQKLSLKQHLKIQAPKTLMEISLLADNNVAVTMGEPDFRPQQLPMTTQQSHPPYIIKFKSTEIRYYIVNIGNPHAVIDVAHIDSTEVETLGRQFNQDPSFPEGVNVSFIRKEDAHHLTLQVYERGVGRTLACGSAACASAVIAIQQGWASSPVTVTQPGGKLIIDWPKPNQSIIMTGYAETVYRGEYLLALGS